MTPEQHEPVTLKLELAYTFDPADCLPDDWEGTREELIEWFRDDMAENIHSWVKQREIYDSIREETSTPDLLEALKWMVEAHDSGLLLCREGTLGDRKFHEKRISAARAAIAKAEGRVENADLRNTPTQ